MRFNVVSLYSTAQALDQVVAALDEQIAALARKPKRTGRNGLDWANARTWTGSRWWKTSKPPKASRAGVRADRVKVGALLLSVLGRDPAGGVTVDALPEKNPLAGNRLNSPACRRRRQTIPSFAPRGWPPNRPTRGVKVARSEFLPKVYAGANYLDNTGTDH